MSPTNEPILHSHFLHPLPNYPILHVDQLAAKLEATPLQEDVLPIFFTDGIPHIALDGDEDKDEDINSGEETTSEVYVAPNSKRSALVQIQHNDLRLVATFSKHGG